MNSNDSRKSKPRVMKSCTPKTAKKITYPDKTSGSQTAKEVRNAANGLSEEERASLFDLGRELIYGGPNSKEKVRARH